MVYCNTVFSQILKLIPRHEFESLVKRHHSRRLFRLALGAVCRSFHGAVDRPRDIVANLSAQAHRLYHLGGAELSRPSLSAHQERHRVSPCQPRHGVADQRIDLRPTH